MLHPVFFTSAANRIVEVVTDPTTGEYSRARAKLIRNYMNVAPWRGVAVNGQPVHQVRGSGRVFRVAAQASTWWLRWRATEATSKSMGADVTALCCQKLYFHRPLHELFGTFFKRGLVMDALEEPIFSEEYARERGEIRAESQSNYTQIPAIMVFRMRRVV